MPNPRRWRMARQQRIQHVEAKWGGQPPAGVKNLVKYYANYFRIDRLCAALELQKLGFAVDPVYTERLRVTLSQPKRKKKPPAPVLEVLPDQDEHFAYIAGYTAWAFAYGITWEEWETLTAAEDMCENRSRAAAAKS